MGEHGECPACDGIYSLDSGLMVSHSNRGSLRNGACAGSGRPPGKRMVFERCIGCGRGDWKPGPQRRCRMTKPDTLWTWTKDELLAEVRSLREQLRLATIDQAIAEADANDARLFLAIERTHIDGPECDG